MPRLATAQFACPMFLATPLVPMSRRRRRSRRPHPRACRAAAVTILTVPPRILPDLTTPSSFPSVLAVDPSDLLLLSAPQDSVTGPLIVDNPGREFVLWSPFLKGYFVCDAVSATALRLPVPEVTLDDSGNLGLDVAPVGCRYVVTELHVTLDNPGNLGLAAELQPIIGRDLATLLYFWSETGEWTEKDIEHPLQGRPCGRHSVVSRQGKLWWVDLTLGLFICYPFDNMPVLRFMSLPEGKTMPYKFFGGGDGLEKCRCVQLSDGKLRFVEITSAVERRRSTLKVIIARLRNVPL
ncbi:hypothetical protein E2562_037798 [Oryza meyeriana var. granulata]|uniref:DUF1618 domain-containing protein n=1 Tax=Oryza meyeriana var. granulata TaxID=110450 RepID=A0A6G1E842_9ORYZ|nr:hypothetical protein E2562_037798 [Oryza meyeriana var. granulata]